MDGIQNANLGSSGEVGATAGPLQLLCAEIGVAASTPLAVRHAAVADALRPYLAIPDLLTGMSCSDSPERSARHLLHAGQDHTVLALVWRLGQMSPVHGHRSWCAFGVHRGYLTEIQFGLGQQGPVPRDCIGRHWQCGWIDGGRRCDPPAGQSRNRDGDFDPCLRRAL